MENGAAFQISWNMPTDQGGFEVRDIDVIRCEHRWKNENCAIHSGSGHMHDYRFEHIRIENAPGASSTSPSSPTPSLRRPPTQAESPTSSSAT